MKEWKVRMYQEGDEESIIQLMKLVWPQFEHTIEHWRWKYQNNPLGYLLVVAECKNEIVGQTASLGVDLMIDNSIIRGSQGCESAVHPEFRRQGMLETMEKFMRKKSAEEGIPISYGFPNEPLYYGLIKSGWFDVCMVPELIFCIDTYNVIKRRYRRLGKFQVVSYFSKFADELFSLRRDEGSKALNRDHLKTQEVVSFDEHIDKFWEKVSSKFTLGVVKTSKYLNWRYLKKPRSDYKAFIVEDDSQIEGYVVLSIRKVKHGKEGYIADAHASCDGTGRHLLHAAMEYFIKQKVDIIKCWMLKDFFWHKILKQNGFVNNFFNSPREQTRLVARINTPNFLESYKNSLRKWYVTYGDWDVA